MRVRVVSCFRTWLLAAAAAAAAWPSLSLPRWPWGGLLGTDLVIVGAAMLNCQAALSPAGGEAAAAVAVPPGAGRGGFMIRSLSSVLNTHWTVRLAGRDDQNVLGNVDGGGLVVATSPGSETS